MKLYLVRHAQSESNVEIHTGNETVLTKTGIEQAKRLGLYFKSKHIDKIYCSKMIRAMDTLKEITPYLPKVPVTYTKKINERYKGILEHKPEKFKEAVKKSGTTSEMFRPPKGENLVDLEIRAQKFIEYLKKNYSKEHILVVSHGHFLRVLINRLFKLHIKEIQYYGLQNAGVSSFDINKVGKIGKFKIDDYKHLLMYSSYERKEYVKPYFASKILKEKK
jgi:broad specificity phosphatase PhoE